MCGHVRGSGGAAGSKSTLISVEGAGKNTPKRERPSLKTLHLTTHELGWAKFAFGFAIGFAKISMLAPTRLKMGFE
jgi:hypothetical protein